MNFTRYMHAARSVVSVRWLRSMDVHEESHVRVCVGACPHPPPAPRFCFWQIFELPSPDSHIGAPCVSTVYSPNCIFTCGIRTYVGQFRACRAESSSPSACFLTCPPSDADLGVSLILALSEALQPQKNHDALDLCCAKLILSCCFSRCAACCQTSRQYDDVKSINEVVYLRHTA